VSGEGFLFLHRWVDRWMDGWKELYKYKLIIIE